jgi:plastocyanin
MEVQMRLRSFLALVVILAVAACSSGTPAASSVAPSSAAAPSSSAAPSSAAASASAAGGGAAAVSIKGFAFNPATIQAKVGENITWTNDDGVAHTVTLDDGSSKSGNINPATTYSHAFAQAGTFTYHCEIHPQMKGTITVG